MGLYTWITLIGDDKADVGFTIGLPAVALSVIGMALAGISYTLISEKKYAWRVVSALIAYILLLVTIGLLTVETGIANSPFLALWIIASIFSGIFGVWVLGFLWTGLTGYTVWTGLEGQLDNGLIIIVALAGYLPLLVSYVLWHSKSHGEKTKEQAYYDLATQLDQVANKSDTVIRAIKDGVIAINNQGIIELINPAAQHLVGWGKQDAQGLDYKSVLQLMASDGSEIDKTTDPILGVLTTNQPIKRNDLLLQTNSGKKINIGMVASPIGRVGSGAIIVFHDITTEQAEEKAQAEFISTASHEMRTPVASIEGYLGLALNPSTAKIDDKARSFIVKAHESAEHLGRLFQDLLDVTKADDGRLSNNPKVIDVVQFAHDIVVGLEHKAKEKNLHLFFKPLTDEIGGLKNLEPAYFVNLDADHLREVIANLVENAIKYTKQGEIIIDVVGDDESVVVSVTDSGIGIPAEDIPHLFQKFYRVDSTDTREIGGTGLGLYLCRRLVEAMEGRIWVESEQGKGSKFSIEVPRLSTIEAQRKIEAGANETKPATPSKYIKDNPKEDAEEAKRRQDALATPIIINKGGHANKASAPPPPPPPAPVNAADPLISSGTTTSSTPVVAKNKMVIPPAIQNMPSNLQKAPNPQVPVQTQAPIPATPSVAPTQQPVPVPAPAQPAPPAQTVAPPMPIVPAMAPVTAPQPVPIPDINPTLSLPPDISTTPLPKHTPPLSSRGHIPLDASGEREINVPKR